MVTVTSLENSLLEVQVVPQLQALNINHTDSGIETTSESASVSESAVSSVDLSINSAYTNWKKLVQIKTTEQSNLKSDGLLVKKDQKVKLRTLKSGKHAKFPQKAHFAEKQTVSKQFISNTVSSPFYQADCRLGFVTSPGSPRSTLVGVSGDPIDLYLSSKASKQPSVETVLKEKDEIMSTLQPIGGEREVCKTYRSEDLHNKQSVEAFVCNVISTPVEQVEKESFTKKAIVEIKSFATGSLQCAKTSVTDNVITQDEDDAKLDYKTISKDDSLNDNFNSCAENNDLQNNKLFITKNKINLTETNSSITKDSITAKYESTVVFEESSSKSAVSPKLIKCSTTPVSPTLAMKMKSLPKWMSERDRLAFKSRCIVASMESTEELNKSKHVLPSYQTNETKEPEVVTQSVPPIVILKPDLLIQKEKKSEVKCDKPKPLRVTPKPSWMTKTKPETIVERPPLRVTPKLSWMKDNNSELLIEQSKPFLRVTPKPNWLKENKSENPVEKPKPLVRGKIGKLAAMFEKSSEGSEPPARNFGIVRKQPQSETKTTVEDHVNNKAPVVPHTNIYAAKFDKGIGGVKIFTEERTVVPVKDLDKDLSQTSEQAALFDKATQSKAKLYAKLGGFDNSEPSEEIKVCEMEKEQRQLKDFLLGSSDTTLESVDQSKQPLESENTKISHTKLVVSSPTYTTVTSVNQMQSSAVESVNTTRFSEYITDQKVNLSLPRQVKDYLPSTFGAAWKSIDQGKLSKKTAGYTEVAETYTHSKTNSSVTKTSVAFSTSTEDRDCQETSDTVHCSSVANEKLFTINTTSQSSEFEKFYPTTSVDHDLSDIVDLIISVPENYTNTTYSTFSTSSNGTNRSSVFDTDTTDKDSEIIPQKPVEGIPGIKIRNISKAMKMSLTVPQTTNIIVSSTAVSDNSESIEIKAENTEKDFRNIKLDNISKVNISNVIRSDSFSELDSEFTIDFEDDVNEYDKDNDNEGSEKELDAESVIIHSLKVNSRDDDNEMESEDEGLLDSIKHELDQAFCFLETNVSEASSKFFSSQGKQKKRVDENVDIGKGEKHDDHFDLVVEDLDDDDDSDELGGFDESLDLEVFSIDGIDGGIHAEEDHYKFVQSMPETVADIVEDGEWSESLELVVGKEMTTEGIVNLVTGVAVHTKIENTDTKVPNETNGPDLLKPMVPIDVGGVQNDMANHELNKRKENIVPKVGRLGALRNIFERQTQADTKVLLGIPQKTLLKVESNDQVRRETEIEKEGVKSAFDNLLLKHVEVLEEEDDKLEQILQQLSEIEQHEGEPIDPGDVTFYDFGAVERLEDHQKHFNDLQLGPLEDEESEEVLFKGLGKIQAADNRDMEKTNSAAIMDEDATSYQITSLSDSDDDRLMSDDTSRGELEITSFIIHSDDNKDEDGEDREADEDADKRQTIKRGEREEEALAKITDAIEVDLNIVEKEKFEAVSNLTLERTVYENYPFWNSNDVFVGNDIEDMQQETRIITNDENNEVVEDNGEMDDGRMSVDDLLSDEVFSQNAGIRGMIDGIMNIPIMNPSRRNSQDFLTMSKSRRASLEDDETLTPKSSTSSLPLTLVDRRTSILYQDDENDQNDNKQILEWDDDYEGMVNTCDLFYGETEDEFDNDKPLNNFASPPIPPPRTRGSSLPGPPATSLIQQTRLSGVFATESSSSDDDTETLSQSSFHPSDEGILNSFYEDAYIPQSDFLKLDEEEEINKEQDLINMIEIKRSRSRQTSSPVDRSSYYRLSPDIVEGDFKQDCNDSDERKSFIDDKDEKSVADENVVSEQLIRSTTKHYLTDSQTILNTINTAMENRQTIIQGEEIDISESSCHPDISESFCHGHLVCYDSDNDSDSLCASLSIKLDPLPQLIISNTSKTNEKSYSLSLSLSTDCSDQNTFKAQENIKDEEEVVLAGENETKITSGYHTLTFGRSHSAAAVSVETFKHVTTTENKGMFKKVESSSDGTSRIESYRTIIHEEDEEDDTDEDDAYGPPPGPNFTCRIPKTVVPYPNNYSENKTELSTEILKRSFNYQYKNTRIQEYESGAKHTVKMPNSEGRSVGLAHALNNFSNNPEWGRESTFQEEKKNKKNSIVQTLRKSFKSKKYKNEIKEISGPVLLSSTSNPIIETILTKQKATSDNLPKTSIKRQGSFTSSYKNNFTLNRYMSPQEVMQHQSHWSDTTEDKVKEAVTFTDYTMGSIEHNNVAVDSDTNKHIPKSNLHEFVPIHVGNGPSEKDINVPIAVLNSLKLAAEHTEGTVRRRSGSENSIKSRRSSIMSIKRTRLSSLIVEEDEDDEADEDRESAGWGTGISIVEDTSLVKECKEAMRENFPPCPPLRTVSLTSPVLTDALSKLQEESHYAVVQKPISFNPHYKKDQFEFLHDDSESEKECDYEYTNVLKKAQPHTTLPSIQQSVIVGQVSSTMTSTLPDIAVLTQRARGYDHTDSVLREETVKQSVRQMASYSNITVSKSHTTTPSTRTPVLLHQPLTDGVTTSTTSDISQTLFVSPYATGPQAPSVSPYGSNIADTSSSPPSHPPISPPISPVTPITRVGGFFQNEPPPSTSPTPPPRRDPTSPSEEAPGGSRLVSSSEAPGGSRLVFKMADPSAPSPFILPEPISRIPKSNHKITKLTSMVNSLRKKKRNERW